MRMTEASNCPKLAVIVVTAAVLQVTTVTCSWMLKVGGDNSKTSK